MKFSCITSDLLDISTPHEYADICYYIKKLLVKYSILPLPVKDFINKEAVVS